MRSRTPCAEHLKAKQAEGTGSSKTQPRRVSLLPWNLHTPDSDPERATEILQAGSEWPLEEEALDMPTNITIAPLSWDKESVHTLRLLRARLALGVADDYRHK